MKIEEVINIYDFLGKLNLLTFIGVTLLTLIGFLVILLPLREKKLINWKILFALEGLILFGMIILYSEAVRRNTYLPIANSIKTNLLYSGYYQKSFRQIQAVTYLKGSDDDIASTLKEIPQLYPTDFLFINMYSTNATSLDTFGLRIIDPNAIEQIARRIDAEAESTSRVIRSFMENKRLDTISVTSDGLLRLIDNQGWLIGQDFFKALIGKNGLMPIYDTSISYSIGGYNIKGFVLVK
jgi:hypothetical protein